MADDDNILLLLSMGFPDIVEIKKALRIAKNDITEAVAILTNEQPVNMDDLSLDIDMRDLSNDYGVAGAPRGNANDMVDQGSEDGKLEFPSNHLYELEQRVFQENWNIPYRKEESFGRCLSAALKLARENLVETDENCKKFVEKTMPEGFKKLLTTNAVQRWQGEVHDGILSLVELYLELLVSRMQFEPVPNGMLKVLSWAFDISSTWNVKNMDQSSRGRWNDGSRRGPSREYARPTKSSGVYPREQHRWLCDLINFFGDINGFETVLNCFKRSDVSVQSMSLMLQPFSNCVELLVKANVSVFLVPCMQKAYSYLDKIEECELKSKEISAVTDLIQSLKVLSYYLSRDDLTNYDRLRLRTIYRMLQAPQFNSKMNALKEVSKLIEESKQSFNSNDTRFSEDFYISENEIVEWMSENKVLTIALEGNIDQVQYADRLKSMVDFLGPMLSIDELTKMWNLQDSPVPHVMDNVHAIMSSAAARFSQTQFDHLTGLINTRWAKSNERIREQLLIFIGQIGRDVQHVKQTQSILQLLWDVSHMQSMPKHLVEKALSEQLAILTEMTMNKDPNRRVYIQKCIDDIRQGKESVVPAVNHLHKICKSYSKGTVIYSKSDKAILSELNDQHSIIQLLCDSLKRSLKSAQDLARIQRKQKGDILLHGRFFYKEYVEGHLEILKFLLKEGDLYLPWRNCEELWEALCTNPKADTFDRDVCFAWFESCLSDLEASTQTDFFNRFLKDVSPSDLTMKGFDCFKAFFECLNYNKQYLRKTAGLGLVVENLDLVGKDFLWDTITDCTRENIADLAINYFLNMSYVWVSPKTKKESIVLHQSFIRSCYLKLEKFGYESDLLSEREGFEIEMSIGGECLDSFPRTSSTDLSSSVFKDNGHEDLAKLQMLRVSRLLLLAERYISTIESSHPCQRNLPPHAETFRGRPLKIKVVNENRKEEIDFESHTNELVCDVKSRISEWLKLQVDQFNIQVDSVNLGHEKDRFLVGFVGSHEGQTWVVKSTGSGTTASSSSMPLVEIYDETSKDCRPEPSTSKSELSSVPNEQEKALPGVVMASGGKIFSMLYKLSNLKDNRVLHGIRRLLHLMPTDPNVIDVLESVSYHSNTQLPVASADASPKLSPRKPCNSPKEPSDVKTQLAELFNSSARGMSAFRVLYNLEVLSARLMPTKYDPAAKFSNDFLEAEGLTVILNIFHHDALPPDVDADIRQSIYLIVLQLTRYLLCGEGVAQTSVPIPQSPLPRPNPLTSPLLKPTPPKKSALDSSVIMSSVGKSPMMVSSSRVVQTMGEAEFTDVLSCLMRIVWAAAAGNLQLAATGLPNQVEGDHQNSYRYYVCRRSSQSSTGSSGSTGSDGMTGASPSSANESLHPGVCIQQTYVHPGDSQIASEALQLLVTCLQLRSNNISIFYNLSMVSDFIIDTVLGSPSESVRKRAVSEYQRLAKIRLVSRSLEFGDSNIDTKASKSITPRQFLTKIISKTPVPLWMPSCKSRGISHSILAQCMEYFDLRCFLLGEMSKKDQDFLCISSSQLLDDELNFLHNFTPCHRPADYTLIGGHLKLVKALLLCEGNNKEAVGSSVIGEILYVYLFPSSRLIADGVLNNAAHDYLMETIDINPKCDTSESRVAAYDLLVELARQCSKNLKKIVDELIRMHHSFNESLSKEFEFEPPIDRRAECNYVGLKNAGATCYMNSVLQQLYNVPNVREQLLSIELDNEDEDTIFYQLQNVFGHLYESKLQHYVPEKFWKCFKLHGVQVNVREQQDAFEFFTQIVDQIDEYLISQKRPKLFARHFEGMWSEVKICQECPHRTKKEQAFMALNLTVRSNNLLDSLQQFVNGELLEGQNAYFCEKCQEKRTAMARTHLKKLPQTLVIQLNRFHYDWETSRSVKFDDYFEFPWMLDMAPYTADGVRRAEQSELEKKHASGDGESSMNTPETPSSNRKVSFSSMFAKGDVDFSQPYELVGVVVHSGQASAGHYYSFIKERQTNSVGGRIKDRWLKFNDTTVEEFDMTEEKMRTECFGGTYKVKKTGVGSSLPEERTRYWNAYMLFYESRVEKKPSRTTRRSFSHAQQFQRSSAQRKISMPAGPTCLTESPAPKESLSELSDLLEKSEKKSLFSSRMPAAIERGIQEENLRFLQSRDVFCNDYYDFIYNLINANKNFNIPSKALFDSPMQASITSLVKGNASSMATESVRLAVNFLLNSFFHIRRRNEDLQLKILSYIESVMERSSDTNEWTLRFISSNSSNYLRTMLLDCNAREVRANFATLIERSIYFYYKLNNNTEAEDIKQIMSTLVSLIEKDVSNSIRYSGQFFWIIAKFAKMGVTQCIQLFKLNAFRNMIKLLLGVEPDPDGDDEDLQSRPRRWSVSQSRELGELHSAIAYLILACDTTPHRTSSPSKLEKIRETLPLKNVFPSASLFTMPSTVSSVLYGRVTKLYIREAVCACREVTVPIGPVVDALVQVSFCCSSFSQILVEELMKQYNNAPSGELKNLSTLLVEILILADPLQSDRLQFMIEGNADLNIDGLLNIVKSNQATDSCRSYQCIKTLVNAANKSIAVKDKLLEDPDRWQWSVNWLKKKVGTTDGSSPSNHWQSANSPTSSDVLSNEDPTTRTFQRTTSAMLTLEDANAILAEFDRSSPICDEEMDTDNGNIADPLDDEMPDLTHSGDTTTAKTD